MADENVDDMPLATAEGKSSKQNPIIPVLGLLVGAAILSVVLAKFVVVPMVYEKEQHAEGKGDKAELEAVKELEEMQRYDFGEVTTNVAGNLPRYVRVKFTLEGTNPNFTDVIEAGKPRINDAVISALQSLTAQELSQTGIKNVVAAELVSNINRALEPAPKVVENIYFTEFVIQ